MKNKYVIFYSSRYKKSIKKLDKQLIKEIDKVINTLANDEPLEIKHRDHALKGKFKGLRECHIKPDLLLIYSKNKDRLILTAIDIGSHSDLFH